MTTSANAALVHEYLDEVLNGHRLGSLQKYWHEDMTSHWLGMENIYGLPEWRLSMQRFFAGFPDAKYTLEDLFFEGDRGVWRGSWNATQTGDWNGIVASGNTVSWTVIIIARFGEGRLREDWVEFDQLGLYRQLGYLPTLK